MMKTYYDYFMKGIETFKGFPIPVTKGDLADARREAETRNKWSRESGGALTFGLDSNNSKMSPTAKEKMTVNGALAEMMLARYYGVEWLRGGAGNNLPDVGAALEVKFAGVPELRVPNYYEDWHDAVRLDRPHVAVTWDPFDRGNTLWVMGWIKGRDALIRNKQGIYIFMERPMRDNPDRDVCTIFTGNLHPMKTLPPEYIYG